MTVAVTGASGYLGEYVTDELLQRGRDVVAFDLDPSPALRDRADGAADLAVVQGDMTSFADISDLITTHDVDDIVQLAYFGVAKPGLMHAAEEQPYRAASTNVNGFDNVVEAARQLDLDTVVAASSTVVYGPPAYYRDLGIDAVDETDPMAPETMYGACKVMNEHVAAKYRELYDLDLALVRIPLIYGPERYRGAAPFVVELFDAAASGGSVTVPDGDTEMDLLYERDVGPLFADVLDRGEFDHSSYNIVGHTVTRAELAELAATHGHPDAEVEVAGGANPDAPPVDDSRFRAEFDFEPAFDAERAAADYLDAGDAGDRDDRGGE